MAEKPRKVKPEPVAATTCAAGHSGGDKNEQEPTPKPITKIVDLAREFGVAVTSVNRWLNKADFPGGRYGPWDRDAVAAYLTATGSPAAPDTGIKPENVAGKAAATARTLMLREQHRKLKLENDRRAGQLIEADWVARVVGQHIAEVREHLLQLPGLAASRLRIEPAKKQRFEDWLRGWIEQRMKDFALALAELSGGGDDGGPPQTKETAA